MNEPASLKSGAGGEEPANAARFLAAQFDEDFCLEVIDQAMAKRDAVESAVRGRLDSKLGAMQLDGFRNAALAPAPKLRGPVLSAIRSVDAGLAEAILCTWAHANGVVRDAAASELHAAGIPARNVVDGRLDGTWSHTAWRAYGESLCGRVDGLAADAAHLMLAIVAGRTPVAPANPVMQSPLFRQWMEELDALAYDASDWRHVEDFALAVLLLGRAKTEEARLAAHKSLAEITQAVASEHADEIRYLGIEPSDWSAKADDSDPHGKLELAEELRVRLVDYAALRPQAATRADEALRAVNRSRCEDAILAICGRWKALTGDRSQEMAAAAHDEHADRHRLAYELTEMRRRHRRTVDECAQLRQANAALETDLERERSATDSLRNRAQDVRGEISELRRELRHAESTLELWRSEYVAAARSRIEGGDGGDPEIRNVRQALDMAERAFGEALVVSLNGRSDPDVPFAKPAEVFDALGWLATSWRQQHLSGREGAHDRGDGKTTPIGESCPGWSYTPHQSETTVGMFREWYETTCLGRKVVVTRHIKKGASRDPRATIRIAFGWDDETSRVVVGFVGLHQRNKGS